MSKKEKLLEKFLACPKTMSFQDVITVLGHFGFYADNKGKTSGSRIVFRNNDGKKIVCHKPHDDVVKRAQIRDMAEQLCRLMPEEVKL